MLRVRARMRMNCMQIVHYLSCGVAMELSQPWDFAADSEDLNDGPSNLLLLFLKVQTNGVPYFQYTTADFT